MTIDKMLHCIGCGNAVAKDVPGQTLAISCSCGAGSPLLEADGQTLASIPASLMKLSYEYVEGIKSEQDLAKEAPHLEYYLGYSDHDSPAKTNAVAFLKVLGCTAQQDCPELRCRADYEMGRLRCRDHNQTGRG